jgi:hypothetical protein
LRWFWRVEDIPDVLRRWGATLPPERVHVVTVPRPGAPAPLLWERFTSVIGLAPDAVDISVVYHPNSGLGRAEVELLRRVNVAHAYALPPRQYERDVKGLLGHEILAASMRSPRLMLPERLLSDIGTVARRWSRVLEQAGYDIVGDLAELVPRESDVAPFTDPPDVSPDAVADAAVTAVFVLVTRLAECRDQQETHHRLVAERDRLEHELRAAREVIREHASLPTGSGSSGRSSRSAGSAPRWTGHCASTGAFVGADEPGSPPLAVELGLDRTDVVARTPVAMNDLPAPLPAGGPGERQRGAVGLPATSVAGGDTLLVHTLILHLRTCRRLAIRGDRQPSAVLRQMSPVGVAQMARATCSFTAYTARSARRARRRLRARW